MHRILKRLRTRWRMVAVGLLSAAILGLATLTIALYAVPLPQRLSVDDSVVVEYRDGQAAHVFLSSDDKWRIPVKLDEVEPAFVDALLRFEDKRFHDHPGFDPIAIGRALVSNLAAGRRVSGASTITMQLVRLLEPRPRTYLSKLIEVFRSMQLEAHMSKDEILESYLSFAPYGRNIEGVEAASMAYFGHRATSLTPEEIATLLAVPQSPAARYPSADNAERLAEARNEIADRLLEEGLLPRGTGTGKLGPGEIHQQILAWPVPERLRDFPQDMPHLAFWLVQRYPDRSRIQTHVDYGLQRSAEGVMTRWRESLWQKNIDHGGAIIVEHATGEVRAIVGNLSFDHERQGSHIPFFDVIRSPGSLLKPFIYAMAIDRGIAHPRFLVEDVPVQAGTYQPENFEGTYSGLVRMEDALARSLNVPFVHLLADLGLDPFLRQLETMGASHLNHEPGHYGLSAALGAVDVNALEVVGMYGALANDGVFNSPEIVPAEVQAWRVMSEEAAWLTRQTLLINDRPDFSNRRKFNPNVGRIHWKTGTSYGHRDAWAAGSGRHYTAIVWFGNLDNRSSHALVGSRRSGPVLFDLIEAVEFGDLDHDPVPDGMTEIEVCSYSGRLPGDACDHTMKVRAPLKSVPPERCPLHVKIDVDDQSGKSLTRACRDHHSYTAKSFVVWPASVRRYINSRDRVSHRVPELHPDCEPPSRGTPPAIVSPPYGQKIVLIAGIDASEQEVPLEADASIAAEKLDWFVDGTYLGSATAQSQVWWTPTPGRHEIVVTDSTGRSASRIVVVSR